MAADDLERLNLLISEEGVEKGERRLNELVQDILEVWINRYRREILVPILTTASLDRCTRDICVSVDEVSVDPAEVRAGVSIDVPLDEVDHEPRSEAVILVIVGEVSIDRLGLGIKLRTYRTYY